MNIYAGFSPICFLCISDGKTPSNMGLFNTLHASLSLDIHPSTIREILHIYCQHQVQNRGLMAMQVALWPQNLYTFMSM